MRRGWIILLLFCASGFVRWNATPSMPRGLFILVPFSPRVGDMVMACPPPWAACIAVNRHYTHRDGSCACGSSILLKYIAGSAGDRITIDNAAVRVNGVPLPNSASRDHDSHGLPISGIRGDFVLSRQQFWLAGQNARSWDSRYFGPISANLIRGVVRPMWTFE